MIKQIQFWLWNYRRHMLLWVLFILYENVAVYLVYQIHSHILTSVTHYIIIITLFYFHADVGLPLATKNRSNAYIMVTLLVLVEAAAYLAICFGNDVLLSKWHILSAHISFTYQYCTMNLYRGLYFMGFSSGYYYLLTYNKEKEKTEELEKQRLNEIIQRQQAEQELIRAQNAFLKAQINPHFLFNTLDFIYHNVTGSSPVAADAIITLAEMMRFAIDADKMGEFICMGDEMEQVNNLIYLSRLRKEDDPHLTINFDEELNSTRFIPLVMLTLIENIFKHGDLSKGQNAMLNVYTADGILHIETDNQSNRTVREGSRTGLVNIEKRLKYAYGDAVRFERRQYSDGRFKVSVQVPVTFLI